MRVDQAKYLREHFILCPLSTAKRLFRDGCDTDTETPGEQKTMFIYLVKPSDAF